ncbi:MAG: type II secretion system protein [Planctomycetota bacterium]
MEKRAIKFEKTPLQIGRKQGVHLFGVQKRRFSRQNRGFSLIEILVVVSVIALILAIGTAVALRATAEQRRDQTRQMMEALLAANDQYKAVRKSSAISHTGPTAGLSSAEQFVAACLEIQTCEKIMLAALNSSTSTALERIYKDNSIFDRWGTELEYRQSNDPNSATPAPPANQAGVTVANNQLPRSRDPFFASAGPDKEWGTDDDITTLQQ